MFKSNPPLKPNKLITTPTTRTTKKGSVLIVVIILMVLSSIIITGAIKLSIDSINFNQRLVESEQARYLVESGAADATLHLLRNPNLSTTISTETDNGAYQYQIDNNSPKGIQVSNISTNHLQNYDPKILMQTSYNNGIVNIIDMQNN